jgi:hypothetical protein
VKIHIPGLSNCDDFGDSLTINNDGNVCSTSAISADANDNKYKTTVDITPPTQLLPSSSAPADTDAISTIENINGTTSNRIYKYEVELFDDSDLVYDRCEIINKQGELGKHVTYVDHAVPDTADISDELGTDSGGFGASDLLTTKSNGKRGKLVTNGDIHTCSFYLLNNEWIGALTIEVAFQRTNPGNLDKLVMAQVLLLYKPHISDPPRTADQTGRLRDCIIQYHDACVHNSDDTEFTSKYFLRDGTSCGSDTDGDDSSADKGDINLQLSCLFLDERYKVNDASGTTVLKDEIGAVDLVVEGINLQSKYSRFYNGMVMSADNVPFTKVLFDDMTRGGDRTHTVKANDPNAAVDFSNKGVKDDYLSYTNVVTGPDFNRSATVAVKSDLNDEFSCSASNSYAQCYAQYTMVHMLQLKYTDLPQFSNSYIGCASCEPLISITGDTEALDELVSTKIMLSVTDLPESNNIININGPNLDPANGGVKLLQPDPYKIDTLYNDITIDTYKLMTSGNVPPRSLDAPLQLAENFTFISVYNGTDLPNAMLPLASQDCTSLTGLKVSDLGLESPTNTGDRALLSRYEVLFAACTITVPDNSFAAPYLIRYRDGAEGASGDATIYQVDGRYLKIGSVSLQYDRTAYSPSVLAEGNGITVVGTEIKLTVKKSAYSPSVSDVDQQNSAISFQVTAVGSTASHLEYLNGESAYSFTTHPTNDQATTWTLQSNAYCTGSINVDIADQTPGQEFNVYKAKIPCARMSSTTPITDEVKLKFQFHARLDLEDDVLTASAAYEQNNSMTPSAFFGTCSNDNELTPTTASGCTITDLDFTDADNNGVFDLYEEGKTTTKGTAINTGMATLAACSTTNADTSTDYIRTFSLAMSYLRDMNVKDAFSDVTRYCDSQLFTMTINREKTATIVAATIENIALQRAVLVKDIGWVQDTGCGSTDYYRLYVLLESVDGDARDGGGAYVASRLSKVQDQSSTAQLKVYTVDGETVLSSLEEIDVTNAQGAVASGAENGNHFKLQGECVLVNDEGVCMVDTTVDTVFDGSSWSDYSKQFTTSVVITGVYNFQAVATNVEITLRYVACPATDDSNDQIGKVVLALQSDCADELTEGFTAQSELQSLAQPDAASGTALWNANGATYTNLTSAVSASVHFDCKKAYSDDFIKIKGSIHQLGSTCTSITMDPKLSAYDPTCALTLDSLSSAWSVDSINITLVRKISGESDVEARLCYRQTNDAACSVDQTEISGETLNQFDGSTYNADGQPFRPYQLCCADTNAKDGDVYWTSRDKPSLNTTEATQLVSAHGSDFLTVFIPLNALGQFPADEFEVRYDVILKNSNMRRHLRATHALRSSDGSVTSASIGGVEILEPEVTAASTQDEPAPNAPEQPVEENVAGSSSSTESSSEKPWYGFGVIEESAVAGLWVIAVVVWLVILFAAYELFAWALRLCDVGAPSAFSSMSSSRTSYAPVSNPVGERFTNLRY